MEACDRPITVTDNPRSSRYEVSVGGELAGFIVYQARSGRYVMTHAEVFSRFEGRGVGSRLAAGALDDAKARGLKVVPRCSFVKDFVGRHHEYDDLVEGESADR